MTELPPEAPPRATPGDSAWLARQEAQRRERADNTAAAHARWEAVKRERLAEAARVTAQVRARTCGTCFLVITPAGTCNCTDD